MGPLAFRTVGALGAVLACLVAAPAAFGQEPLLPDMKTQALPVDSQGIDITGDELRFANSWENHGRGPYEIAPVEGFEFEDCDGDGEDDDVPITQRIYLDMNSSTVFERPEDTDTEDFGSACMIYHDIHDHYHVNDVGLYTLLAEPTGAQIGDSIKTTFCMGDGAAFDSTLPGAPPGAYYDFNSCKDATYQGISVGWFDTYTKTTQGQSIDIAGIGAGNYCLRSEFDPFNQFAELNDDNNLVEQRYLIDPDQGELTPLAGACNVPNAIGTPDIDPPNTKIKRGPKGKTRKRRPKFRFRADEPATFTCKLDRKRWRPCESPRKFRRRSLGRHKFKVRATDLAGNVERKPAKRRFRIVR
ncbi:MAG: lysyl oxidase family protein [Solirubrobacterales bacterium]